jgi:3-oxocholest-4-en-26-oyl-CoA dehydrogenase beta subunit
MNFGFTEEQEILRKFASDFLNEKYTKKTIKELENGNGHSPEIWTEMASLGWLGLPFAENYGGAGMSFFDQAVLLEEMGRACAISPYFSTMLLAGLPIYYYGTEEQKKKYLPDIASGKTIGTLALYEDSARFVPESIQTVASFRNSQWNISGTKLFVPDAHLADYVLCVAITDSKADFENSLTVFAVNMHDPNIQCKLLATRTDKLCEIKFNNVSISDKDIVGKRNKGWEIITKIITIATIGKCCEILGTAQKALDMTINYAKERKQYGRTIASFQAIQHYAAEMLADLSGMKISTYKAAWLFSENLPCDTEIAIAKLWAVKTCENIINQTHQIHGAIGVTLDYDLHYYTKRLKMFQLTYTDKNYCNSLIAKELFAGN